MKKPSEAEKMKAFHIIFAVAIITNAAALILNIVLHDGDAVVNIGTTLCCLLVCAECLELTNRSEQKNNVEIGIRKEKTEQANRLMHD